MPHDEPARHRARVAESDPCAVDAACASLADFAWALCVQGAAAGMLSVSRRGVVRVSREDAGSVSGVAANSAKRRRIRWRRSEFCQATLGAPTKKPPGEGRLFALIQAEIMLLFSAAGYQLSHPPRCGCCRRSGRRAGSRFRRRSRCHARGPKRKL